MTPYNDKQWVWTQSEDVKTSIRWQQQKHVVLASKTLVKWLFIYNLPLHWCTYSHINQINSKCFHTVFSPTEKWDRPQNSPRLTSVSHQQVLHRQATLTASSENVIIQLFNYCNTSKLSASQCFLWISIYYKSKSAKCAAVSNKHNRVITWGS